MARHRGIFKRKGSDSWYIRYAGLDGRIIRESAETVSVREVETKLEAAKTAMRQGKEPEKKIGNHSFAELVKAYKEDYLRGMPSEVVASSILDGLVERRVLIGNASFALGTLPLRRFDTLIMERLQKDLQGEGYQNGSINRAIGTVKRAFAKGVDWNKVEENVLKRIRKVKMFKEVGRLRYLSAKEAQDLISVCDDQLRPIVITALHTGCRKNEILKLRWENVDLQHGYIAIPKTKNGERRDIPIDRTLREMFRKLPRTFTGERDNREMVPYVFHNPRTFKAYVDIQYAFTKALKRAGITDYKFHDNRHTYASLFMMNGGDLATLSRLLGHKSLKMTMRYAHFAPAHMQKATVVMDRVFGKVEAGTDTQLTHSTESAELQ